MSYMKAGRAQKWTASARVFRWEQQEENSGQISSWTGKISVRSSVRNSLCHMPTLWPLTDSSLESNGYYQKNRSLDDYVDEFQDLIVDSGYTDPKTIVVKFQRGLNTQIQNAVATTVVF
jgi:hypothetical protein